MNTTRCASAMGLLGFIVACGSRPPPPAPAPSASATASATAPAPSAVATSAAPLSPAAQIVAATDRDDADRAMDTGRHPAEMLEFFGIGPGMKVAEIIAGFGYTTELLARAVGPSGVVYGQNNKFILEKFAEKGWAARLAKPANKNVVRVDRELEAPFPPDAKELDAVIDVLFYHDTVWMKTDRGKMNKSIFAALKKGGVYGIIDHSGRAGTGVTEVMSLHRIEEKVLREEVEKVGFKLAASAEFMRNASDPRDWNAAPNAAGERRGTSDRFVLKFVKP